MPLKILAFSAICDRVGLVFLVGGKLKDWRTSRKAARSSVEAAGYAQQMLNFYQPNVVVVEKITVCRKGEATCKLIQAIAMVAEQNYVLDVAVERDHPYQSKYEEAQALVKAYPLFAPLLPEKRQIFDSEPRAMVLFEALALGNAIAHGGAEPLAAAM
ncbi:MAG: hypothetical protein ACX930_11540 [Erythrobacter sp.]